MSKASRPLTILHIFPSMRETSAPYNEHCLALSDKRHITICVYRKTGVIPPKTVTAFEGNGSPLGFFRALKAALAEQEYDIIHIHASYVGLLFLLANLFMQGKLTRRAVFTVHNSYQSYKFINKLLLIPIFAFLERVICCSKASFESFPRIYKWLAVDRLCFVENGLDLNRINQTIRNTQHLRNGDFTIVTVTRLIKIKNLSTVLKAFHQSADRTSRLVFIGEGDLRDLLMAEIKEFGLAEHAELKGLIPREKVYEHLLKADLFISASLGEGLPIAVLEAMACRCPVILSDIKPHREIASDVDFIPLIRPDDIAGFAHEIKRFRQISSVERAEMGEKCGRLVEERFSLTAMHKKYEEIYAQVLGKY